MVAFAKSAHTPVEPGTFADRILHEKDRRAKLGDPNTQAVVPKPSVAWPQKGLIPSQSFKLLSFSSESDGNDKLARHAIDSDPTNWWHTNFAGKTDSHPHELVIDLGDTYAVSGLRYLARQDSGWNGSVADCEVSIANSADFAGAPPMAHRFKKSKATQEFTFKKTEGRYLRFRLLSEVGGGPWGSIGELGVIGKQP